MTFDLDSFRLDGKVAVVTGAGGRENSIGRAYAMGLAKAGAALMIADLSQAGAERVADEIRAQGGTAFAVAADIADPASVAGMAAAVEARFGGADILVNNAAIMAEMTMAKAIDYPLADWQRMLTVNLTGALLCCQAIVPQMRARGGGRIVNQVSAGAYPAKSVYGITKLALVGLTTTLASELGREGINVNAIAPGSCATDARDSMARSPEMVQHMERVVTMRYEGRPDELVGALLLLCSPAGSWVHGQVLHVDGGWVL